MNSAEIPSFAACSSTSTRHLKYDVFLSCGDDTSKGFSDHLFKYLNEKGIHTFRGYETEKGETIVLEPLKAIQESKFAVVVFSEEYPSSAERLDDLVKISEVKLERVYPLFYHVEPSEVRKQKGTFGNAFEQLLARKGLKDDTETVKKWKDVLSEVANFAGWDVRNRYESEVIQEVATKISNILNDTSSGNDSDLVGIDSRIQNLLPLLSAGESDGVRVMGIWGMPGIGKTKLAEEVFERIRNQFGASCFIENVREEYKKHNSLVPLQKQVYETLLGERPRIQTVFQGTKQLGDKLRYMKVLIILDDVDGVNGPDQIKGLTGDLKLASGSRIIVTTRNKHVLEKFGENNVFRVAPLMTDEALQLLSKRAFNENCPPKEYGEVCSRIVTYANGLPLALKVLGSLLDGKSVDEWSSTCESLKEYPDESEILCKLKLSFDGLRNAEKELFLDIACFFKGEPEDRVKKLLEHSNRHPRSSIGVLVDKALITFRGDDRRLWMHDLLQELGWEIVRRKSFQEPTRDLKEPCERSRLWLPEDIIDLLEENKGTQVIEGLFLTMPDRKEINFNDDPFPTMKNLKLVWEIVRRKSFQEPTRDLKEPCERSRLWLREDDSDLLEENKGMQAIEGLFLTMPRSHEKVDFNDDPFPNMKKLKLLKIHNADFSKSPGYLCNELRLLEWHNYPSKSLPSSFQPKELVELNMSNGCIEQLWEESNGVLHKLLWINLSHCKCLSTTPCFRTTPNLERLTLKGCISLSELHPSIEVLKELASLNLEGCENLSSLPGGICSLTSLKTLNLSGCSKLEHLPENLGEMEQLEVLKVSNAAIREVPSSITRLQKLKLLTFRGCKKDALDNEERSESLGLQLPGSFAGLDSLESLDLSGCNLSQGAIPLDIGSLSSLQSLDLSENHFTCIHDSISQLSKLRILRLNRCKKLLWLPKPPRISLIEAHDCSQLRNNPKKCTICITDQGVCTIDCSNLEGEENDGESDLMPVPGEHLDLIYRRSIEDAIYRRRGFVVDRPRKVEIPEWCTQSSPGSSISIQLSDYLNTGRDSTWMGIALCFVHSNPEQIEELVIDKTCIPELDKYVTKFTCHFDTEEGRLGKSLDSSIFIDESGTLCNYIPREWFSGELNYATSVKIRVLVEDPKVEVKMCGALLITDTNVAEFIEKSCKDDSNEECVSQHFEDITNLVTKSKDSIKEMESAIEECLIIGNNELTKRTEECTPPNSFFLHIEEADRTATDTSHPGRDELQTLISSLFEGSRARNYIFACIFPVKAILPQFRHQCVGNNPFCCIPPSLYDNNTWVGLALYAVFTWHPSALLSDIDLKAQLPILTVDVKVLNCRIAAARFPLKRDNLSGLHRLVLFHIPRVAFSDLLKETCSIESLFETTISHEVEIEMCGMRLVYEQDLKEMILTVTECTLQSPEVYHQRYCENFAEIRNGKLSSGERIFKKGAKPIDLSYTVRVQSKRKDQESVQCSDSQPACSLELLRQRYYESFDHGSTYNSCFPPNDIPEWLKHYSDDGPSVKIQLLGNLLDESNWMGLALWASFTTKEYPDALVDNLQDSSVPHYLICKLETNRGTLYPLHFYKTTKEELKWLHVGGFIWLCYLPRDSFADILSHCEFLEASFGSDRPGLCAQKCAVYFVDEKVNEFGNIVLHCMDIFRDNWDLVPDRFAESTSQQLVLPFFMLGIMAETPILRDVSTTLQWQGSVQNLFQHFFKFNLLVNVTVQGSFISTFRSFDPDIKYNFCFPHKEILGWFQQQSCSSSVEMQVPHNILCHDSKWLGIAMCASFEVNEHPTIMLERFGSEKYANLLCHFQIKDLCLKSAPMIAIRKEKFKWFYLRGFIWITYIPYLRLPAEFYEATSVRVSFHSPNCPSLIAKKCGIRLLYKHDVEEFQHMMIQYMTSFFDDLTPICQYIADENEKKYHRGEGATSGKAFENPQHSRQQKLDNSRELLDFDRDFIYNSVFPCVEILEWFSHYDSGPSVAIEQLPPGLESDGDWIGLALCSYFSNIDNPRPTNVIDHMNTDTSHCLTSRLQTERGSLEPCHSYQTQKGEFKWLNNGGQFLWLSFLPRRWFLDQLQCCSSLKASFASDYPGFCSKKCGLRIMYRNDEDEFKQTILVHCVDSLFEDSTIKDYIADPGTSTSGSSTKVHSQGQQEGAQGPNDIKGKQVME